MNHWVNASPPDPGKASTANAAALVDRRLTDCAEQRGLVPNVVAVDFAVRANLAATVRNVAGELVDRARDGRDSGSTTTTGPTTSTTAPLTTSTTAPSPVETIPQSVQIPSLTGGDPTRFCAAVESAVPVLLAWAYAAISEPPDQYGVADLVYGPALERAMEAYSAPAPVELAAQALPLLNRARAASDALRQLGLNADTVAALAGRIDQDLRPADRPDAITLQRAIADEIGARIGASQFAAGAAAFYATQGDASTVADLGDVSGDVATAAGYGCITDIGTIG